MMPLRSARQYLIVVLVLGAVYGVGIWWGLKSEFSPSVDVPFPLGPLIFVGQYSDPTQAARYPALQYLLMLPFYGAFMAFLMLTGGLSHIAAQWPYGFADPVWAFTILQLISRTISLLMGIGLLLALWKTRDHATNRSSHLLALSLLALSWPFTFYAREGNLDVPHNFWWALAVLFAWRYLFVTHKRTPDLVWAGVFAAFSMATKDAIAGALVGLGLSILLIQPEGCSLSWLQKLKNTALFGLSAAGTYLLVAIAPQPARWWYHISLWTLNSENVADYTLFPATPKGYVGLAGAVLNNLASLISPVGLLLVLVGLFWLLRSRQGNKALFFLLPALTYIFIIIMSIRFVYERYMLPVAVVMVPLVGIGASYLATQANPHIRRASIALGLLAVASQAIFGYLPVTYMQLYDTKRQLAETLDQYVNPSDPLLVLKEDVAHFPNADVYTRYRLMLANGQKPDFRSEEHLYAAYAPGAHCLLSPHALAEAEVSTLVASWENPPFVSKFLEKQVLTDFYLYDVDGQCRELTGKP